METITGTIESIIFHNKANGYTVARFFNEKKQEEISVVLFAHEPYTGQMLELVGEWDNHKKYGKQLKVNKYQSIIPSTEEAFGEYLKSGIIKGIGPGKVDIIINHFGEKTREIFENEIDKLIEVSGIGQKTLKKIKNSWSEQEQFREIMIELQGYNISPNMAMKIIKQYENETLSILKENPYQLSKDIWGFGFRRADEIAQKIGIEPDNIERIKAGILFQLEQSAAKEGNVFNVIDYLKRKTAELLKINNDSLIEKGIVNLVAIKDIVIENENQVYLSLLFKCEDAISEKLLFLKNIIKSLPVDFDEKLTEVQKNLNIKLADKQVEAVKQAFLEKVFVITGGPGTGKTTIINTIIKICKKIDAKVLLSAPTGRAAKRIEETSGSKASTLHRLLEYSPHSNTFNINSDNPLDADFIIVDETSMIDTYLMYNLVNAVPSNATLILVGDIDQLPSVGPGKVLKDIIDSDVISTIKLDVIFRQAQESQIITNAHKINNGMMPVISKPNPENDFIFIETRDNESINKKIFSIINYYNKKKTIEIFDEIQILSPMRKTECGIDYYNTRIQDEYNDQKSYKFGFREFKINDRVMQLKNNYDNNVFNGDVGVVTQIDDEDKEITVNFEGNIVLYDTLNLDQITLAYAITIHKSQGSEYPIVIIPLTTSHNIMLQRNLIYTAVTRSRYRVIIVGSGVALKMAVNNNKIRNRLTGLKDKLLAV